MKSQTAATFPDAPRLAILGLGSIGRRHARNFAELGCQIVGFDPCFASNEPVPEGVSTITSDRSQAIETADAVVIATPNEAHLSDLQSCIDAGRSAFVEKPIGHDPTVLDGLINAAQAKALVIFPAMNLRFLPVTDLLRNALEEREIGRPVWARFHLSSYLPDWRPGQDYRQGYAADPKTGGVLFDVIHEFDLAWHLLGPARLVTASAGRDPSLEIPSEHLADVVLRHDAGPISTVHVDYLGRPPSRCLEIQGTEGRLWADLITGTVRLYEPSTPEFVERLAEGAFASSYVNEAAAFLRLLTALHDDSIGSNPSAAIKEAADVLRLVSEIRKACSLPCP